MTDVWGGKNWCNGARLIVMLGCMCLRVFSFSTSRVDLIGNKNTTTSIQSVRLLSNGRILIGGLFDGTIGGQSIGGSDMLVQLDSVSGSLLWNKHKGSTGADGVNALAVDEHNNVFAVGWCTESLPGVVNNGGRDWCLLKYDGTGKLLSSSMIGGNATDSARGVAVSGDGKYLFVVGDTESAVFHAGTGSLAIKSAVWMQLDTSTGAPLLAYQADDQSPHSVSSYTSVACDRSEHSTWIAGYTNSVTYSGQLNHGGYDMLVHRLTVSSDGKVVTKVVNLYGGIADDFGLSIAVDGLHADFAYIAGYSLSSPVDGATSNGGVDVLLVKVDRRGHHYYSVLLGGLGTDMATAVVVDGAKQLVYLTGTTESVNFYGQKRSHVDGGAMFLLAVRSSDGAAVDAILFGDNSNAMTVFPQSMVEDTSRGLLYISGYVTASFEGKDTQGVQDGLLLTINVPYDSSDGMLLTVTETAGIIVAALVTGIVLYILREKIWPSANSVPAVLSWGRYGHTMLEDAEVHAHSQSAVGFQFQGGNHVGDDEDDDDHDTDPGDFELVVHPPFVLVGDEEEDD